MKITFQFTVEKNVAGSVTYQTETHVLGENAAGKFIRDLDMAPTVSVDVEPYPGAEKQSLFDRRNRVWDISWTTTYYFATEEEAFEFKLQHMVRVSRLGELRITTAGGSEYVFEAVISKPRPKQTGQTLVINYTAVATDNDINLT